MNVVVNGEERSVAAGAVVADVLPKECRGIAVALNWTVVPRAEHRSTALRDGDRVEIVTAVQGG
ncbi:sulfur carrier protein ThiS [Nocardioides montaniterrae]